MTPLPDIRLLEVHHAPEVTIVMHDRCETKTSRRAVLVHQLRIDGTRAAEDQVFPWTIEGQEAARRAFAEAVRGTALTSDQRVAR